MTQVTSYYQEHKKQYPEPFRLRIHRSLSWLEKAEASEDTDTRFLTYWIAFNAAYANEIDGRTMAADRSDFRTFLQAVCHLDKEKQIYQSVWSTFSGSIRVFLDNQFVFQPFWDFHNGKISESAWEEAFAASKKKIQTALVTQQTDLVLMGLFDRLYTLRNQIVHGGATFNSSANRQQLHDACEILSKLIPQILLVMMHHPEHDWGKPFYPFVKES